MSTFYMNPTMYKSFLHQKPDLKRTDLIYNCSKKNLKWSVQLCLHFSKKKKVFNKEFLSKKKTCKVKSWDEITRKLRIMKQHIMPSHIWRTRSKETLLFQMQNPWLKTRRPQLNYLCTKTFLQLKTIMLQNWFTFKMIVSISKFFLTQKRVW